MLVKLQGNYYLTYKYKFSKLSESNGDNFYRYSPINENDSIFNMWEETKSFRLCYRGGD